MLNSRLRDLSLSPSLSQFPLWKIALEVFPKNNTGKHAKQTLNLRCEKLLWRYFQKKKWHWKPCETNLSLSLSQLPLWKIALEVSLKKWHWKPCETLCGVPVFAPAFGTNSKYGSSAGGFPTNFTLFPEGKLSQPPLWKLLYISKTFTSENTLNTVRCSWVWKKRHGSCYRRSFHSKMVGKATSPPRRGDPKHGATV